MMLLHAGVLTLASISPALCGPIAHLRDGDVEGIRQGDVGIWRGIPYAAAPVGDLRWRPPQAPSSWRPDILQAQWFAKDCTQLAPVGANTAGQTERSAEDCLYINVYAPLPLPEALKPVFLWIHGGGFQSGGGILYDGAPDVELSGGRVLLVTLNYRLNVFGFAASSLLRSRDPGGSTGNYGILDQRFAMQWVKENIDAFGGDASRVTIIGQSAGADSVANHLVRRNSWGLFSGAGLESGAFYPAGSHLPGDHSAGGQGPTPGNYTVADQEGKFAALLKRAGCGDVDCLLRLPAHDLLILQSSPQDPTTWVPVVDGVDLVDAAPLLAARGELARVPVLVGSTMEDIGCAPQNWSCDPTSCSEEDFWQLARAGWGFNKTEAARLAGLYGNEGRRPFAPRNSRWYWAAQHAGADAEMTCAARRLARWATQVGQQAFWYYWTYAPLARGRSGADHGCELPFVFRRDKKVDPSELPFAAKVAEYWIGFVANATPHGPGLTTWPRFSSDTGSALVFGDGMAVAAVDHLLQAKCDFWDRHFGERWGLASESVVTVLL